MLAEQGRLSVDSALKYAEDIASALKTAHDRDILHRDIKPGNVMISTDDRALLGDFGLARILPWPDSDSAATTRSPTLTQSGAVVGTPRFMSPEQVLGRPLDKRSDIFAFGVLLYEICTGRPAFSSSERGSVYDAIIHREPEAISRYTYEVPEELERIIRKTMAKRPEERYQDAADLIADLRTLRRQREFKEYSDTHPREKVKVGRRFPTRLLWLVPALALFVWLILSLIPGSNESSVPEGKPIQVTSTDSWEGEPAISPDGGRVAYASDEGGNYDIYLVDVHGGTPLRLTEDPAIDRSPAWFPDGRTLAFVTHRGGDASIWKIGQLGGGATPLIANASQPAISPDGSRVAFCRVGPSRNYRIGVASIENPESARMITDDSGGMWDHQHPTWSPDGSQICYATRHGLWVTSAEGGNARRLTTETDLDMDPVWSPSGQNVYFSSYREGTLALWRVGIKRAPPVRLTIGTGRECMPSVSVDGTRLAYATDIRARTLIIKEISGGKETAVRNLPEVYQPAFSPDQSLLAFVAPAAGGQLALWLQPLRDGEPVGAPRQLTDDEGHASHPVFSPDGEWIAYYRIIGEERDIWTISTRGGSAVRFTEHSAIDLHPTWSPDGSMLAFVSEREGMSDVWFASIEGGRRTENPQRLTGERVLAVAPVWSPDGTEIAFVGSGEKSNDIWIVRVDGSEQERQLTTGAAVTRARWDPQRGELLVCATWGEPRFSLRRLDVETGDTTPIEPVIDLGLGPLPIFDVSSDGGRIVFAREEMRGDIWLLEAERGGY